MIASSEQALAPPRPNLGPEPWSGDGGLAGLLLVLAMVTVALVAYWVWIRRRRRSRPVASTTPAPPVDESPEARLVALCEQLRGTLSARFGPELQARTTEEIAGDAQIRALLSDEQFERLTEFLHTGDRLKFARRDAVDGVEEQLGAYASWASAIDALPPPPPRQVKAPSRRSHGDRSGRRSPGTRPRPSGA